MCENERGSSWNNCSINFEAVWEISLIKCDFTAEIQPRKTDSGTEPVSVGVVWIKKTSKNDTYHMLCWRKIVLQDSCIRKTFAKLCFCKKMYQTLFDRTSSVSQYETQTFNNRLKTTLTLDMSGSDVIRTSDSRSITWQLWKDLTKQFLLH